MGLKNEVLFEVLSLPRQVLDGPFNQTLILASSSLLKTNLRNKVLFGILFKRSFKQATTYGMAEAK